ncbi:hypothetical protein CC2G_005190 [Coprinopsis cinerea AmutBmut pab1-1]|nr:hypothetical protein CC2G_005190 [Coprinopsis cinerea AmutBmut pab1-1]
MSCDEILGREKGYRIGLGYGAQASLSAVCAAHRVNLDNSKAFSLRLQLVKVAGSAPMTDPITRLAPITHSSCHQIGSPRRRIVDDGRQRVPFALFLAFLLEDRGYHRTTPEMPLILQFSMRYDAFRFWDDHAFGLRPWLHFVSDGDPLPSSPERGLLSPTADSLRADTAGMA